jgi:multiple sugar transport system substrate-binding protein
MAATGGAVGQQIELTVLGNPNFTPEHSNPDLAAVYRQVWDKFEAENPGIKLKVEPIPGGADALQDVLTRGSAGRLGDVGVVDTFWVPRLEAGGYLKPLDGILADEDRKDFLPGVLEATTHAGVLKSIYIYNSWRGLFYRRGELKALGYDAPPAEWNAFLEFGKKIKEAGTQNAVLLPATKAEATALYLLPQYFGLGGELHDADGKPNFFEGENRAKLAQVYDMWRGLVENGLMTATVGATDEVSLRPFFYSRETATIGSSSSFINQHYMDVPDLKGDLGVAPLPMPAGSSPVPLLAAWGYVVFTDDPARADAAKRFVKFMLDPAQLSVINMAAGQLPVRKSIWEMPHYADDPLFQQLYEIHKDPRLRERSRFPIYPAIKDAITEQMAGVLDGSVTTEDAIDRARDAAMAAYERLGS